MTDLAEDPLPVGANHDPGIEFAPDSPLEGDGFEPSVPRSGSRREARLTVSPITVKDGASVEPIVAHNGNLWRVGGDWFFHSALCWMHGICRAGTSIFSRSATARASRLCDCRSRNGTGRNRGPRDERIGVRYIDASHG